MGGKFSCQTVLLQLLEDMGDRKALMHRHHARYAGAVVFSTDTVPAKLKQLLQHMTYKDATTG